MSEPPAFLPRKLELKRSWDEDVSLLYAVFEMDFKQSLPRFRGKIVLHHNRLEPNGRESGFWHLITQGDRGMRNYSGIPDYERAERLPWVRATIEHADAPGVLCWDYEESSGLTHTYLWLEEHDFVVILEPVRGSAKAMRLLTAYCVHDRAKMRRKYERRVDTSAAP